MALLIHSPELPSVNLFQNTPKNDQNYRLLKNSTKHRVSFTVCSRINEVDGRVSNSDHAVRVFGQLSAVVEPSTTSLLSEQIEKEDEKQNYYVNTGYAIRTLREDFPDLFHRELNFDIYRDDIVFKDPLYTFAGIENYKSIFWALRFHGRILFKALWVDITTVWQPVENMIMVRWTVHGIPRVPWESRGRFDGTSEYKLDKNGKIYEHRVHNIALNAPPKFRVLAVSELIQSIGCSSTPKPTYFEISSPPSVRDNVPPLVKFTGVGNYLASMLAQKTEAESAEST